MHDRADVRAGGNDRVNVSNVCLDELVVVLRLLLGDVQPPQPKLRAEPWCDQTGHMAGTAGEQQPFPIRRQASENTTGAFGGGAGYCGEGLRSRCESARYGDCRAGCRSACAYAFEGRCPQARTRLRVLSFMRL